MFKGGIADKLGNRYEAKWLVRQLLDVIGDKAQWLRYEGISSDFCGFEFAVGKGNVIEWYQAKINRPNGNWTLLSLKNENVLSAFKRCLNADYRNHCIFVSQDPAKDISALAEKAKIASSAEEFEESLGRGHATKLDELCEIWDVKTEIAFLWLQRCYFSTESQLAIESLISAFAELYFYESHTAFAVLREFLEVRINRQISTENARHDIRSEGKLKFKDWSLDPSLRERLATATTEYLQTYIPFGAGGSTILRVEAQSLLELVLDPAGPRVILLTGEAGSGKSGVIRRFIDQLKERDILYLAFRVDHHLNCSSPKTLGKTITDRDECPTSTLKGLAPNQTSVLIVDQLDAVSEVSGRNGLVKQTVLRFVDNVRSFGSIRLVLACRTFDLDSDERLKALKNDSGIKHVNVPLLAWKDSVEPFLISRSVDVNQLSEKQRDLLRLPLNLSIFLEIYDVTQPLFTSPNDLFARLLEKKGRSIRVGRLLTWELIGPLAKLAEWMSEQQRLEAPEDTIAGFAGALDVLASEGLIVRSRRHINFFHESFFDYIYARTFYIHQQSLESLLLSSEQHLFRRTQTRQILVMLRQDNRPRYVRELREVLNSKHIRYHIKVVVAQWLGSLADPLQDEQNIIDSLDSIHESFPLLVRYAFLASPGWFDKLYRDGWILTNLVGDIPERTEYILWWLSKIAGDRPTEIAKLLNDWWGNDADRGDRLLGWFGLVRRNKPDTALTNLCCRVVRSNPPSLFGKSQQKGQGLFLHVWMGGDPAGASEVIKSYFDVWFDAHPDHHPFEQNQFRELDIHHSFNELAKNAPRAFVEGVIGAVIRAIDLIIQKNANGKSDYTFRHRAYSGDHVGSDEFLNLFRSALGLTAKKEPDVARLFLTKIDPLKHEVATHLWLETIAANGMALSDLLPRMLNNPYLFDAGWSGADWKSFSDATKATIPYLTSESAALVEQKILSHYPELTNARELVVRPKLEGEMLSNRKTVLVYMNRSGHEQWCILENIGDEYLTNVGRGQLAQLRRKFPNLPVPDPHHHEAHWVGSPIESKKAAEMTDAQWLNAIEHYNNDDHRRYERTSITGGARQLSQVLQQLVKEQPVRFAKLIEDIPDDAHQVYVSHILWGLAETDNPGNDELIRAILNAHARPSRPFGSDIVRLISKHPLLAANNAVFDILTWYVEHGEANDKDDVDSTNTAREILTVDDLLNKSDHFHIRGINGERGSAAEALGKVIGQVPEMIEKVWAFLERRVIEEPLISVRCCLMTSIVPLYNYDKQRCAALVERLSRFPTNNSVQITANCSEGAWLTFAFPSERFPGIEKREIVRFAEIIEKFMRRCEATFGENSKSSWWSPIITRNGVYLLSFLINSVPDIGRKLIYRLLVCGDESSRMIGAWHVLMFSFQDDIYVPLANALFEDGVVYRTLAADIASQAITNSENRSRAESVLERCFNDDDQNVRSQAAEVFHKIKADEFVRYKELANQFLKSRSFDENSSALFHALEKAECRVDDLVVPAAERFLSDIERNGNYGGRKSSDLLRLRNIMKNEYTSSEDDPKLRSRLLDVIDKMLMLELHGTDEIINAHER